MKMLRFFIGLLLSLLPVCYVLAAEPSPWSVEALAETSVFGGNAESSWLEGDRGKFRVGEGDNNVVVHGAAGLSYDFSLQSKVVIEAAYHHDPNGRIGITQAYWRFKPLASEHWQSQYRVGAFHLPISLEHTESLWQSIYTIAPSMINTWVGEELRTIGAEGRWSWKPSRTSPHKLSLRAAAFGANDTAGAMLSWRGWAAHSRQSLLGETIKVVDFLPFDTVFTRHAKEFEPYVEIDDKVGYYLGLDWTNRKVKVSYLYYDNRADPLATEDGQWGWDTRFHHVGLKAKLSKHWTVVSQFMSGNTIFGPGAIDNNFSSGFLLLSRKVDHHRISARMEAFDVEDNDFLSVVDPNDEHGYRVTANYSIQMTNNWSSAIELSQLRSTRDLRGLINEDRKLTENQVVWRIRYQL